LKRGDYLYQCSRHESLAFEYIDSNMDEADGR